LNGKAGAGVAHEAARADAVEGGRVSAEGVAGREEGPVLLHDLGRVEAELERLWQANAAQGEPGRERAVLRAATFNLVAITPTQEDGERAAGVLAEVMAAHPGRVLVLCVDLEATTERLAAWVAMHCRAIGGGSQVCGEQVIIVAAGDAVDRVGGTVLTLLLPDCLAVAWWRGGPGPAAPLLDRLVPGLDALLLDGARFDPVTLARWVARVQPPASPLVVGDLAWERGHVWRRWTADAFEPPELRPALAALDEARIACAAGGEMAGLLHLGWLASRLGWAPRPGLVREAGRWQGRLGSIAVEVSIGGPGAGIGAVTLAGGGPGGVRLELARATPDSVTTTVSRGAEVVQRRVFRHPEPDEVQLVGRWLEHPRRDPLYTNALAALTALLR
jgi:glucose-6-phosphate dehydrogenase assembly protein OpcA